MMWYDVCVVAVLLFTTLRGAAKGAVWQLAAIAGLVLCLVFAESLSAAFGPYVRLEPPLNHWAVMFGAYLVFSFVSYGIARLLNEWIEKAELKEYNRHLGAVLGFVKGVVICLVATFFIVTLSEDAREMLKHSRSGRWAAIIMDRLHPVMPEKLRDSLDKYIHQLDSPDLDLKYSHDGHSHDPAGDQDGQGLVKLPAELDALLSTLPEESQVEFRGLLERTLRRAEADSRRELERRLQDALEQVRRPEDMTSLKKALEAPAESLLARVTGWLSGERSPAGENGFDPWASEPQVHGPAPALPRRTRLMQEIAAEFSDLPRAQAFIRDDIERQLADVPERVALSVLEDWRTDLLGGGPDPDPNTTASTPLPERIVRRMSAEIPEGEIR
jgi:membrane protein required for colicin V production